MDTRANILAALRTFARQRPGMEPGNYASHKDYRAELRTVTRDLAHAQTLLRAVELSSIGADAIIEAARGAFSGRLSIKIAGDVVGIGYCAGQYFPTEYRKAVCAVLASALWNHFQSSIEPSGYGVDCMDDSGMYVRATRRVFDTQGAANQYAASVAPSRHPLVYALYGSKRESLGDLVRAKFRREFGPAIASRYFN